MIDYAMPEVKIEQIVVYKNKGEDHKLNEPCPKVLWGLLDVVRPENNLYFVSEQSLHYFISENVGHDLYHKRAKALRRCDRGYTISKIKVDKPDTLLKDLSTVNFFETKELAFAKKFIKVPSQRLKDVEVGKEC